MITVAFVHVGEDSLLPRGMVASARRAMSDARILHLADEHTTAVPGADEVIRLPYDGVHMPTFKLQHLARLQPCDAAFLDTDIIVQQDLSPLFDTDFDVALTRRENAGLDPSGTDIAKLMPYNGGVLFSKPSGWDFWINVWQQCETYSDELRKWWGDQYAIKAVAQIAPLKIRELACDVYNYSPSLETEDLSGRAIIHYKGERKAWMLRRARVEFDVRE